jgi:hypothetical protein
MSRAPALALLTDFGLADWYVAAMKGELLRLAPGVPILDVTHSVALGDVRGAAFVLSQAWPWLPEGTVTVVVVDPGVGSERRALGVAAASRLFVGPDNGVLTPALEGTDTRVVALDPARVARRPLSATFHGRDLFAPAAALLALGTPLAELGKPVRDPVRLAAERPLVSAGRLVAHVVHVDRFGDCITDLVAADLAGFLAGRDASGLRIAAGRARLSGLAPTYAAARSGEALALWGSGGRLEIAVRDGHAGLRLGLAPGSAVELSWEEEA